ncbi:hypothetical protein Vi05172_g7802 [Venturia inaequalis]|nr:hypothetical protein Vi05172_g7802 [Venturia inaequalis]
MYLNGKYQNLHPPLSQLTKISSPQTQSQNGPTASFPDSSTTKDIIPNGPGIRSKSPKLKFVLDPLHANFTINIGTPGTQPLQSFRVMQNVWRKRARFGSRPSYKLASMESTITGQMMIPKHSKSY